MLSHANDERATDRSIQRSADAKIHASAQRVKAGIWQYGDQLTRYALPLALTRTAQDAKLVMQRAPPETGGE